MQTVAKLELTFRSSNNLPLSFATTSFLEIKNLDSLWQFPKEKNTLEKLLIVTANIQLFSTYFSNYHILDYFT